MSDTKIDERIVSMEFDNKEFEKNVQQSLTTLEKLKLALKFDKNYSDAFKGMDKASKQINFESLNESIDTVKKHFDALEIMGVTALVNITNQAINTGKRIVDALTFKQIEAGFTKYAEKTSSVQTIINATGKSMEEVTEILEKLNWFTDETSYNFLDMVNNIGKFTSNNIELERAETAMEGIATWAAISGANSQAASRAMYNISQSISQGSMKLMDWMSIENANMATAQFKQTAMETAAALGTLKKDANGVFTTLKGNVVTVENFRTTLSDSWFTAEAIMQSLDKYGGFAGKLYDATDKLNENAKTMDFTATKMLTYIDSYKSGTLDLKDIAEDTGMSMTELTDIFEELGSDTYELGRKSFKAAQEAKTFSEAIDATKDAVSTGWMNIFEQIFGTYEEAKQLWTGIANLLYDMFAAGLSDTAELLKEWKKLGGRKYLLDAFANSLSAILTLLEPIKQAWRAVFPETEAQTLVELTEKLSEFTSKLKMSEQTSEDLRIIFTALFSVLKTGLTVIAHIAKLIPPIITLLRIVVSLMLTLTASVTNLVSPIVSLINPVKILSILFTALKIALLGIVLSIGVLIYGIRKLIYYIRSITIFSTVFENANAALNNLIESFTRLMAIKISNIPKMFSKMVTEINKLKNSFINSKFIQTMIKAIGDETSKLYNLFNKINASSNKLSNGFLEIGKAIRNVFVKKDATSFFDLIIRSLNKVKDFFKNILSDGTNFISKIFGDNENVIQKIRNNMANFVKYLKEFTKEMGPARLSAIALSISFIGLSGALSKATYSLSEAFVSIKGFFGSLSTALKKVGAKSTWVRDFGFAIAMIAGSLFLLAQVPTDQLLKNTGILVGFIAVIMGLTFALEALSKKIDVVGPAAQISLTNLGLMFMSLSTSVIVLTAALKILENVKMDKVVTKIVAIGAVMIELAAVTALFGRVAPKFKIGAFTMLIVSASVNNVVKALDKLSTLNNLTDIKNNIIALGVIMTSLGIFARGLGSLGLTSAIGILILINSIDLLVPTLTKLSNSGLGKVIDKVGDFIIKLKEMYFDLIKFWLYVDSNTTFKTPNLLLNSAAALLVTIVAVGYTFDKIANALKKIGLTSIAIATSIYILSYTFKMFDELNMSGKNFRQAERFLLDYMAMLTLFIYIAGESHKITDGGKMASVAATIVSLTLLLSVTSVLFRALGKIDYDQITKGILAIGGIAGAMALILAATSTISDVKMGTIIALMLGLNTLFSEVIILSTFEWNEMATGVIGAVVIAGALYILLKGLKQITDGVDPKNIISFGVMALLIATSLIPVAEAIGRLAGYSIDDLKGGAIFVALIGAFLTAILGIFTKYVGKNMEQTLVSAIAIFTTMISTAFSMYLLAESIEILSSINFPRLLQGMYSFMGVLLAFSGTLALLALVGAIINKVSGNFGGTALFAAIGGAILLMGLGMLAAAKGIDIGTRALSNFVRFILKEIDPDKAEQISQSLLKLSDGLMGFGKAGIMLMSTGAGLILVGAGLTVLATGLGEITEVTKTGSGNRNNLYTIASGLVALSKSGVYLLAASPGYLAFGVSFAILSSALTKIDGVSIEDISYELQYLSDISYDLLKSSVVLAAATPFLNKFAGGLPKLSKNTEKLGKALRILNPQLHTFSVIAKKAAEIGKYFVDGLIKGFEIVGGKVLETSAGKLGYTIIKAVCDVLEIHSPSKIGIWIGKMFGVGVEEGMESDADIYAAIAAKYFGSDIVDSILNFWNKTDLSGISNKIIEGFTGTEGLFSDFGISIEGAGDIVESAIDKIKSATDDDPFKNLVDTMKNSVDLFSEFSRVTDITASQIVHNMNSQLEGMLEWKDNLIALLDRGLSPELYDYLLNMGQKEGWGYVYGLLHGTDEEIQRANDMFASYQNGLYENSAKELYDIGSKSAKEFVDGFSDTLGDEYDDRGFKKFKDEYDDRGFKLFKETGESNANAYAEGVKNKTDSTVDNILDTILTKLKSKFGVLENTGEEAGTKTAESISNNTVKTEIDNTTKEFSNEVSKDMDKNMKPSNYEKYGTGLISGVIAGVMKKSPEAIKTVSSFAASIVNVFPKKWNMHSPSKITENFGAYLIEGLDNGILKNTGYVLSDIENFSDKTLDIMQETLNNIRTYVSDDMDLDPVIRPVLDVSQLESGANHIASIFNGRYSAGLSNAYSTNGYFNKAEAYKNTPMTVYGNNSDVVGELTALRNDIGYLGEAMTNLKVVMNGDAVVGEIAPAMDTALGTRLIRNRREK